jgi:hypothetical protein
MQILVRCEIQGRAARAGGGRRRMQLPEAAIAKIDGRSADVDARMNGRLAMARFGDAISIQGKVQMSRLETADSCRVASRTQVWRRGPGLGQPSGTIADRQDCAYVNLAILALASSEPRLSFSGLPAIRIAPVQPDAWAMMHCDPDHVNKFLSLHRRVAADLHNAGCTSNAEAR